jgi:hypothetical protein
MERECDLCYQKEDLATLKAVIKLSPEDKIKLAEALEVLGSRMNCGKDKLTCVPMREFMSFREPRERTA